MNVMDEIKVGKVENVRMLDRFTNNHSTGTLFLTPTHLIFKDQNGKKEIWVWNTHIAVVEKQPLTTTGSPLYIKCKHFLTVTFIISKERDCHNIYVTLMKLSFPVKLEDLYCFKFRTLEDSEIQRDGWNSFDIQNEFQRQGVPNKEWNQTYLNTNYELCDTYPKYLYVPASCSNQTLMGSAKFRSKERLPVLTYLHSNKAAICRCSQPLSGFNARCPEDEQMLYQILCTNPNSKYMYVVDTRPRINAMANRAAGKGYENENFYDNIKFRFFGIENIHVMRASLSKLVELQRSSSIGSFLSGLESSGWLKHIRSILETGWFIARAISNGTSVVVHCSDGWDRTAQVCSIAALLLDPFYRTMQGFQTLIEKDWLSFGHKFSDRCGYISSDGKEVAPIFTQFIDATYQLLQHLPSFSRLDLLFYWVPVAHATRERKIENGDQLFQRERTRLSERTDSLWSGVAKHINEYINPLYACNRYKDDSNKVLQPKLSPQSITLWRGLYFRFESGVHPRETWQDVLLTTHDHSFSLEDHVKLLLKHVDSLRNLIDVKTSRSKSTQDQYNYDYTIDNDHSPNKTIEDQRNDETIVKDSMMIEQLESELKSVALEWKSSRKIDECICSTMFDVFSKKYHCWSCGNVLCKRCIGDQTVLIGHLSQRAVPTCKSCSQNSPVSS
ncbi:myotubularin-related protein 6 isoform X2 [Venturia canescens]|uniref:myotubularin-related protein 6 isoform X2 n=1 Tax=Venturia canescens TaxID=32260 RepID=UPI001C9C309A|nr:myotubularin-related protein 6 isoform X2 [Venturia canescens]